MSKPTAILLSLLSAAIAVIITATVAGRQADAQTSALRTDAEGALSTWEDRVQLLEDELSQTKDDLSAERNEHRRFVKQQRRQAKQVGDDAFDAGYEVGYEAGHEAGVAAATGGGVVVECPDGIGPGGGPCGWGE